MYQIAWGNPKVLACSPARSSGVCRSAANVGVAVGIYDKGEVGECIVDSYDAHIPGALLLN